MSPLRLLPLMLLNVIEPVLFFRELSPSPISAGLSSLKTCRAFLVDLKTSYCLADSLVYSSLLCLSLCLFL